VARPPTNFCACCVCFILMGKRVPMFTIIKGHAVCEEHMVLAAAPRFDVFRLRSDPSLKAT
jgi:hypothetical protein